MFSCQPLWDRPRENNAALETRWRVCLVASLSAPAVSITHVGLINSMFDPAVLLVAVTACPTQGMHASSYPACE